MEEIEIRGKLNKAKFEELTKFLSENGKLLDHHHRLTIDISPGFNPTTRSWNNVAKTDLRVKKSDNKEKISLKIGDFSQKERKEIEVDIKEGEFLKALQLLVALGFDKGMIYYWESWEYEYKGFEIKLSQYTNDYYAWEIESGNSDRDPDDLAKEFGLHPFTREEYYKEIDWQNQNINKLFSLAEAEKYLRKF